MLAPAIPLRLMVIGLVLLLASWLVLLMMVIKLIAPSMPLSLIAYAASVGGLAIGVFGAIQYARHERRAH